WLALGAGEAAVPEEMSELRLELSRIETGLADALTELQEISRGIHPAILSRGGLGPALQALARRSAIPVEFDAAIDAQVPERIEVVAYYVVSEALANATKASRIDISLAASDGALLLSVRDDGVGGAIFGRGSGLVVLQNRVEALAGKISVEIAPGNGTSLVVALPIDVESRRGERRGPRGTLPPAPGFCPTWENCAPAPTGGFFFLPGDPPARTPGFLGVSPPP